MSYSCINPRGLIPRGLDPRGLNPRGLNHFFSIFSSILVTLRLRINRGNVYFFVIKIVLISSLLFIFFSHHLVLESA